MTTSNRQTLNTVVHLFDCSVLLQLVLTHHSRSSPRCLHLHTDCVRLALEQRSFAAQLHVEVGGVRSEAEILSEGDTKGRITHLCQAETKLSQHVFCSVEMREKN